MSGNASAADRGEPNLTPILDMVFQLITFFMLVINFKAATLDMSLRLPVVGSARPIEMGDDQTDRMVLNIDADGRLIVYGSVTEMEKYLSHEAETTRERRRADGKPIEPGGELPTTIVVRADQAASFSAVNRVLKYCQSLGYRKFSLKAMNREEAP